MDIYCKAEPSTSIQKNINERSNQSNQQTDQRNEELQKQKESFLETDKDEVLEKIVNSFKEEYDKVKATVQEKQNKYTKREDTCGISGQLYEIYLVLLILLHGITNKIQFHLASNLKEAGDFDDVVFCYSFKDLNGAEKFKVTFLQAKHKEKTKNVSLENLLGTTGKGAFQLKKYFSSFRHIKKSFEGGNPTHPIFGRNFNECEFIIYTNALFKNDHTEKGYINELFIEEDWVLNFSDKSIKYYKLCISETEDDRIKKYLANFGESDVYEFQEFLTKLKICFAQPNQGQLKKIIKEKIQTFYGVRESDIESVFAAIKNKVEEWWKDSCEYLTEKNTFIQDATRVSIKFEVQDPVPVFTGREQTLRDLHEALQTTGQSVISQSASITGLGGIGKTELAKKYISEYSQHYDNNIIWINAETYTTCSESFNKLAEDALKISIKNKAGEKMDITSIIYEVYEFFNRHGRKSLFIFDNADIPQGGVTAKEDNIKKFLPSGDNKPYILITTRNQQWGGIKTLHLDLFSEEESAQFITTFLNEQIELNENEVNGLALKLQYLPLALRQAVAYIATENERLNKWNESYTIENYLKDFDDKASELLGRAPQDVYDVYQETVLTTWQVTMEKIKEREQFGMQALLILNMIAFFGSDNIPIVIFERLMDKSNIRSCVEILEQYSLVKLHNGVVTIHRLLQQVIRIILKQENKDEDIIETTLSLFKSDLSSQCIIHVQSVWDFAKYFNKIVRNFSYLPERIIEKVINAVRFNEAYLFAVSTHKLFKDVLGVDHHHTLSILHYIAVVLFTQGKYIEALTVYQEVLGKLEKNVGPDHPDTLITITNLALVFDKQGKYEDSLRLNQEALFKLKGTLGLDHRYTLMSMHNLALILDKKGKYEESLSIYRKVLCKSKEILRLDHPFTLITMHNMASVLNKRGNYEESLNLYQQVLCKRKEILVPDHHDTLATMHNLVLILVRQEKYEAALSLCQEILYKKQKIFGPNHPDALTTMQIIAYILIKQGKYEESLSLFQQILPKSKEIFCPAHPFTLTIVHNMAAVLKLQRKYEESLNLYQEVLCKRTDILGIDHPDTLTTMNNLAALFSKQGKYEESIKINRTVLCKRKEILGFDNPNTLKSMHNLAYTLCYLQKYKESLSLYQEVLSIENKLLGPNHPSTLKTMDKLASILHKQGNHEESLRLYEEILCSRMETLGPDHPHTLTTINSITSIKASSTGIFSMLQSFLNLIFRIRPS